MKAHLEPIAAIVRVGPDDWVYGDPYTFAAAVRWLDPRKIEVLGAVRAPTPGEWRALRAAFRNAGVATVLFRRMREAVVEEHRIEIG